MSNSRRNTRWISNAGSVLALASLAACNSLTSPSVRTGIDPSPAASAPSNVKDSFSSTKAASSSNSLTPGGQDQVVIQKSSLEKEFLFSGNSIPQTGAATSSGLLGHVVIFRREGQKVFMLEATQGQVVSPTLPSTLILASFPILSESDTALTIDFNQGMSQAYTDDGMYTSDQNGLTYQPATSAQPLRQSYLESVQIVGNILEIRQAAQVPSQSPTTGISYDNFEFRYYLEPYHPNPNFTPVEIKPNDFEHVGYFEVNPVLEPVTGRSVTRVAMRDLSKPVVYAISANTPPQYHDSVREGILYWNKVFGREVVQAIDAPAGVTAPDPQYNVIQWVENDDAGFAYADILADPRSGEILHSQVYLTSVFGTGTAQEIPGVLREYARNQSSIAPTKKQQFSGLFASARVCERGMDPNSADEIVAVKAQAAIDPSVYQRIVNSYVQFVVTHEVGHTLGLRHNFAGSLADTATPDDTDKMFQDYLLNGTVPPQGQYFASSVMDYNSLSEDVLHVAMFNSQNLVLPYDQMAIDWAYAGKPISSSPPPFCTDTQATTIADCLTFDRGAKPVIANQQAINKALRLLGYSLAESYIDAKAPADPRDAVPFQQVPLNPDTIVSTLSASLTSQISWLKSGGNQSIAIMNQFPFLTTFFTQDLKSTQDDSVSEQFAEAGGVDSVLMPFIAGKFDPTKSIAAAANAQLAAYLKRPDVLNGTGAAGQSYALSDSDVALIKANGAKYFKEIEDRAFDQSITALAAGTYTNAKLAPDVEKMLGDIAEKVIMPMTQTVIAQGLPPTASTSKDSDSASPSPSPSASPTPIPPAYAFAFKQSQRLAAVALLNQSLGGTNSEWSIDARTRITNELTQYLTSVMGQKPGDVDPTKLSEPLRGWFSDQANLLNKLGQTSEN